MTLPYHRLGFPKETSLAELYHENTKIPPYVRDAPEQPPEEYPHVESLRFGNGLALPPPLPLAAPLGALLRARRSRRAYSGAPVPLAQLVTLLHAAYGVTGPLEDGAPGRAAPSAGARYPLDLFVSVRAVDGLEPGIWHYVPETHELEPVARGDATPQVARALFEQDAVRDASFVLLVGATFARTMVKYGDRGYRLVLLDAGHAVQNLLLAAEALGLGATGLGGFVDDELAALCRLDRVDEHVVYAAAVGARLG